MKYIALTLAFAAALCAAPGVKPPTLPRPVGNMSFNSVKGKISMDKYKGKVTVLMFFHTSCAHCATTAQLLNQVRRERRGDFEVVGVAVDESPESAVTQFIQRYKIDFPIGWVNQADFFKYTDLDPATKPFIPVVLFIDRDFQVNRQYSQDHPFFKGEPTNMRGVVNMLVLTAPGKSKDLPRTQTKKQ
ncbi:MAG: TlpA disulfide reductase family protein [Bryobacteraceae bacterium]